MIARYSLGPGATMDRDPSNVDYQRHGDS